MPWHDATPASTLQVAGLVQATAAPQLPLESQVCTPPLPHCVAPGTHEPTQLPLTHAELLQAVPAPQLPVESQVSTLLPTQRDAPTAQTPVHAPLAQVWLVQATVLPH